MSKNINEEQFIINLKQAYIDNIEKGIKYQEIAMQKVIEKEFNTIWWKVCTLSIFNEILINKEIDPILLSDKILKNIKENLVR